MKMKGYTFFVMLCLSLFSVGCHAPPMIAPPPDERIQIAWVGDDALATGPLDLQTMFFILEGDFSNSVVMDTWLSPKNVLSFPPPSVSLDDQFEPAGQRFVLLQLFGLTKTDSMQAYLENAGAWINTVVQSDATPVLLYPWFTAVDSAVTRQEMDSLAHQVAWQSQAVLIPVGPAWEKIIHDQPQINLYASDGIHASAEGVYLSACVIYASLTGESPLKISSFTAVGYDDPDEIIILDGNIAQLLRLTAWEIIQDYQQKGEFQVILLK